MILRPWPLLYSKAEACCRTFKRSMHVRARTFWGGSLEVVIPDRVSLAIYRYGFYEADLTRALGQLLKPGMIFFDVGLHVGYYSALAARLVGPTGQVHAFEPTPSTLKVLSRNLNVVLGARVNNLAVWCRDEELTLKDFGVEFCGFNSLGTSNMSSTELGRSRSREIRVRARSIDSYVEETGVQPDVVKIDTEGAELDVLRGMAKLLRSKRPLLTIEVGDVGLRATAGESRWVVEHMLAHDYQAFELTGDRFKEHTLKDSYPHGNLLFRPKS